LANVPQLERRQGAVGGAGHATFTDTKGVGPAHRKRGGWVGGRKKREYYFYQEALANEEKKKQIDKIEEMGKVDGNLEKGLEPLELLISSSFSASSAGQDRENKNDLGPDGCAWKMPSNKRKTLNHDRPCLVSRYGTVEKRNRHGREGILCKNGKLPKRSEGVLV